MENGLTFLFKADDLRALLSNTQSTHVYIVASLTNGNIGGTPVAVMTVVADSYKEVITPTGGRMERVSQKPTVGCPVPPCKDPDKENLTEECQTFTESLLNTYKNNDFTSGFNLL